MRFRRQMKVALAVVSVVALLLGILLATREFWNRSRLAIERREFLLREAAQRRNVLLLEMDQIRAGERLDGWSTQAWAKAEAAAAINNDTNLQIRAAGLLAGLDTHPTNVSLSASTFN